MEKKNFTHELTGGMDIEWSAYAYDILEKLRAKHHKFMAEHAGSPLLDMLLDLNLGLVSLESLEPLTLRYYYQFMGIMIDDEDFRSLEIMEHLYDGEGTHTFVLGEAAMYPREHEEVVLDVCLVLVIDVNAMTLSLETSFLYDLDIVEGSKYTGKSIGYMLDNLSDLLPCLLPGQGECWLNVLDIPDRP